MNDHIKNLQPYKLTSHKAWEYTDEQKENILKLDWNEANLLIKDILTGILT